MTVKSTRHDRAHTPAPWVDLVRKHWGSAIHSIDVRWRPGPNGTWETGVSSVLVAEVVGKDTPSDPSQAADLADSAWAHAWEHLDKVSEERNLRRAWYKLQVYGLDAKASLVLLGETTTGGRLDVDNPGQLDETDSEDAESKAWLLRFMQGQVDKSVTSTVRLLAACATMGEKCATLFEKAGALLEKANEGQIAEAWAKSTEAKMGAMTEIGKALIQAKAPEWKAAAEAKLRAQAERTEADLPALARYAAHTVDGPTAMRWDNMFDWRALVAVCYRAGEDADWEAKLRLVMGQLAERADVWNAATATCVAAFGRVAEKLGLSLG